MKKKILSAVCALAMVFGSAAALPEGFDRLNSAITASAETTEDGFTYEVLEDGTVRITGYNNSKSEISIPEIIDGKAVTSIGDWAFIYCTKLENVIIPDSITDIREGAFYECSSLKSITIPDSITRIGDNVFNYCTSLESVTIPDSVTSIGERAFYCCTNLESITIPSSVTSIDNCAFYYCISLESVTIPNGVTSLGEGSFLDCSGLTNITIPNSVTSIGGSAFSGTPWLDTQVEKDPIVIVNSILIDGRTCKGEIIIPKIATSIAASAFYENEDLISITIPDTITSIGKYAFYDCNKLETISIPSSIETIGNYAFYTCDNLASITISNGVESIGESAFSDCKMLTSVFIPDSVKSIGDLAFEDCTNLTNVTISNRVTSIGERALGYFINTNGYYERADNFTIYGIKGSEAETYANDNGFKFVASDEETITLPLTLKAPEGSALAAETVTVTIGGDTVETAAGEITLPDLADGRYAMTVSADNYVPRTYSVTVASGTIVEDIEPELHLIGDITGDGKLNAADLLKAKSHIKGVSPIEGYEFDCANVDGNKALNAADLLKMKAHMKGATPLWT